MNPKFLAGLPRVEARSVPELGLVAHWLGATCGLGARVTALAGQVTLRDVALAGDRDPLAARCDVRIDGVAARVFGPGAFVRDVAQRLLGGPAELAAPRPLTIAERAIWTLVVAAALVDLGVPGQAFLAIDPTAELADPLRLAVEVVAAGQPVTVWIDVPRELARRVRPPRPGAWSERVELDVVVAVARCAVAAHAIAALAVGDIVTTERVAGGAELVLGDGAVALSVAPGAVVGTVATEYVPRDMAIADDAELELVVAVGTTRLSLRRLAELAVGQVVPLGRPVAGPFELRAAGRVLGRGELVDVDGELGVRVVSLGDSP